uniref:Uncharacterized protein n=1 Tax=Heliothis virescens TaxID=7102 RepID=A0A2A4JIY9_HELVI
MNPKLCVARMIAIMSYNCVHCFPSTNIMQGLPEKIGERRGKEATRLHHSTAEDPNQGRWGITCEVNN